MELKELTMKTITITYRPARGHRFRVTVRETYATSVVADARLRELVARYDELAAQPDRASKGWKARIIVDGHLAHQTQETWPAIA